MTLTAGLSLRRLSPTIETEIWVIDLSLPLASGVVMACAPP